MSAGGAAGGKDWAWNLAAYSNTARAFGLKSDFDADFSVALSSGFNMKMSSATTVSSEIRGKWSEDSSTISGKLGLKIAF